MDIAQQINTILQDQAIREALNASAYELVSNTMKEAKTLAEKLAAAERDKEAMRFERDRTSGNLSAAQAEIAALKTKVAAYEKREGEFLRNELRAEFNAQRVNDHVSMVGLIFRNVEVRRETFGSLPVAVEGGNGSCGFVSTSPITATTVDKPE